MKAFSILLEPWNPWTLETLKDHSNSFGDDPFQ